MPETDVRWQAIKRRDARLDGRFFYSVVTTGVFCYPSCGARLPRYENIAFHESRDEAVALGYRPCARCRPDLPPKRERERALVVGLCRLIDQSEAEPSLEALARHAHLSTSTTQRVFKRVAGVTPKAYAAARRAQRLRSELGPDGVTITDAFQRAGYGSSGRFYEQARELLGMAPGDFQRRGAGTRIRFSTSPCSLGHVLVAATEHGVCCVLLGDEPATLARDLRQRFSRSKVTRAHADFDELLGRVVQLVEDPMTPNELPLDIRGTIFQKRVWTALRQIPAGEVRSYAQLARELGAPRSARAVARACATNPVAVAVPCHRVVRSDGALSGYRWGIDRKRELLQRESRGAKARSAEKKP